MGSKMGYKLHISNFCYLTISDSFGHHVCILNHSTPEKDFFILYFPVFKMVTELRIFAFDLFSTIEGASNN